MILLDARDYRFRKRESAGGSFVADVLAVVSDIGGDDAAAVLEDNRIRRRGRHGEQKQSRKWRCAMHTPILAMPDAYVRGSLLVYALSGYTARYAV